jgi:hypothetical protein
MSAATPTDKAKAEAAAKAALAAKRKADEAAELAKREEYRRDVPPGTAEIEAELRARKPPVRLLAALHKAQGKIETVRKNGTNPHFKSKYATLDEVWETVRGALSAAGLVVYCTIETTDGGKQLTTHVAEITSGEELSCSFPIVASGSSPQVIGSAMTYARRYTSTALLEIVTGDGLDDDGEAATNHNATPSNGTKKPAAGAVSDALGF